MLGIIRDAVPVTRSISQHLHFVEKSLFSFLSVLVQLLPEMAFS